MRDAVSRRNRGVLAVLGLLVAVAAGVLLALGLGAFGAHAARTATLPHELTTYFRSERWIWAVVGAAGLVVAILALRWLVAQLHPERVRELRVPTDPKTGVTTLAARALTDAASAEIDGYRSVQRAAARLTGDPSAPRLHLVVTIDERGDVTDLRARIGREAIPHVRSALDQPDMPVVLDLRVGRGGRRVV